MRIDLVFPRFKLLSGAERLALELAAGLVRAGHQPRIICHQFDETCRELVREGVDVVASGKRLDWFSNRYLNAAFDYQSVRSLRDLIGATADAVVLFGPALRLAPGLEAAGRATVYHCFEPPRVLYQDRADVLRRAGLARLVLSPALAVYRRIDQRLVKFPGAITASGPYAAHRVEAVYGRSATPITHGIDRAALDDSEGEFSPTDLVTVNYLHPRKRVDLAIRALARLERPLADSAELPTLRIVGGGPERDALESLAAELGVADRVLFAGFVPGEQLGACYRSARGYLHTAREESFGLSVIEAAYSGLPVIAVAEGGVVDNVEEGSTGTLVEATPESVAAGIVRTLDDARRSASSGDAGRHMVDARYTWDHGAADLLRAIASAQ